MNKDDAPPASLPPRLGYGVYRQVPKGSSLGGWAVHIKRDGHQIRRLFKDQIYGSSEAALAMATAYRDEVLAAFPPLTNREAATRLRKANRSGISGVFRTDTGTGGDWHTHLCTLERTKRKRFSVRKYGEAGAKARALAWREAFLADLSGKFLGNNKELSSRAGKLFADQLEHVPEVQPHDTPLSTATFTAKLAEINAHFDALRPVRLKVRVRHYAPYYAVYVSDCGHPAKRKLANIYRGKKSPEEVVLAKVRKRIEAWINLIYHPGVTRWFMEEYGNMLLDPARFDPNKGFILDVWVPPELVHRASVAMKD